MYKQEKKYVILAKEGRKIADAGLLKISLTDEKIRLEYLLNNLPLQYGVQMECVVKYRQQGEVVSTKCWKDTLKKTDPKYVFSVRTNKQTEEIMDCRLIFPGNMMVVSDEKESKIELPLKSAERQDETGRNIQYIRNLEYLKQGDESLQELYYNSFLLHGFYQYRYFVVGKDFIGVPDHFYEREAIAAKMMGFPYFMEAEHVENCNLDGEMRNEAPKMGSFGYYLMKLSPDRGVQHSE